MGNWEFTAESRCGELAMPRVVPPARSGAGGGFSSSGRPIGVSTWKPESIKALQVCCIVHSYPASPAIILKSVSVFVFAQAALEANQAHQRKVEALQYELDEQSRTQSDDVRKKMSALREVLIFNSTRKRFDTRLHPKLLACCPSSRWPLTPLVASVYFTLSKLFGFSYLRVVLQCRNDLRHDPRLNGRFLHAVGGECT